MDPINPIVPEPVAPVPAPAPTPAPVDPQPADPAKMQADREQALQDALDAALDQLNTPATPGDPTPVVPPTPAPVVPPAPVDPIPPVKPEPIKPVAPTPSDTETMAETMSKILKNQEDLNQKYTNLELKDEMIAMTSELRTAIIQFPHANEKDVLADIEKGSEKSITELAKESHERYTVLVSDIEKKTEERLREQLKKEYEGKISVPQSGGSSSTPAPDSHGLPPFARSTNDDDAWANALKESKNAGV